MIDNSTIATIWLGVVTLIIVIWAIIAIRRTDKLIKETNNIDLFRNLGASFDRLREQRAKQAIKNNQGNSNDG